MQMYANGVHCKITTNPCGKNRSEPVGKVTSDMLSIQSKLLKEKLFIFV